GRFLRAGEKAKARRPGAHGRPSRRLAQERFRPGPWSCDGDLGRLQVERMGRRNRKHGETSQGGGQENGDQGKMTSSQSAMPGQQPAMAARVAAAGTMAVALIIVALH